MDIEGLCFVIGMGSILIVLPVLALLMAMREKWKNKK